MARRYAVAFVSEDDAIGIGIFPEVFKTPIEAVTAVLENMEAHAGEEPCEECLEWVEDEFLRGVAKLPLGGKIELDARDTDETIYCIAPIGV